jgi:uncharacterized surface protein with fasciclin (FAS1) repeats
MKTQKGNSTLIIVGVVALLVVVGLVWHMSKKDGAMMMDDKKAMESDKMAPKDAMKADDKMMKEEGVMVGGAMMVASKDIVDNAVNSKDHTTLVAAVKAAGLVETLKGTGPFTVFAPTNAAFAKLPAGTVDTLVKPENKAKLTSILTYHVVAGKYTSKDIKEGMTLKTVQGEMLTFTMKDGKWWINGTAMVTIADIIDSNGATHVIDAVLMPKM